MTISPRTALAQTPAESALPPASPPEQLAGTRPEAVPDARLAEAKELFRSGNEFRKEGDFARALDLYLRSRALVPSIPNTLNAGFCLDQLARFDEALELYEELVTSFRAELSEEDRQAVGLAMTRLRRKLGAVDISSNVDGTVVIGARMRGKLPLTSALRLLPGEHRLRVMKDGYESFERSVVVKVGETIEVDAKLRPLAAAGRLRVDLEALRGGELYVDDAFVGALPWEGTLSPGGHVILVRKGDLGSAPAIAKVIQGQVVTATVVVGPLGPPVRVMVQPKSGELLIDEVPLGSSRWEGRLRKGRRVITARAEGYRTETRVLDVGEDALADVRFELKADPTHPRWAVAERGRFWVQAFGHYAMGSTLGGDAESSCESGGCLGHDGPMGVMAGVRGGYELPVGLSVSVGALYLQAVARAEREVGIETSGTAGSYVFRDEIRMAGPAGLAGLSWRHGATERFDLVGSLDVGIGYVAMQDRMEGSISGGGQNAALAIEGVGNVVRSPLVFLMPGLAAGAWFGPVRVGVGLSAAWFMTDGPRFDTQNAYVATDQCPPEQPPSIHCAPGTHVVASERSHGRFLLWLPGMELRYRF